MSMLEISLLLGGQVVRSIDLATGEIIAMRQQVALSSSGGGSLAGNRHVVYMPYLTEDNNEVGRVIADGQEAAKTEAGR